MLKARPNFFLRPAQLQYSSIPESVICMRRESRQEMQQLQPEEVDIESKIRIRSSNRLCHRSTREACHRAKRSKKCPTDPAVRVLKRTSGHVCPVVVAWHNRSEPGKNNLIAATKEPS